MAERYISVGKLVPDDVTVKVVEERLNEPDVEKGIILDGFPRNLEQAKEYDEYVEMRKTTTCTRNL